VLTLVSAPAAAPTSAACAAKGESEIAATATAASIMLDL
jgi:hypothetical protein